MTIILTEPDAIQAFAYLQLYYKLKLVVHHPNGPRWRQNPAPIIRKILAASASGDVAIKPARSLSKLLAQYDEWLKLNGIRS